MFVDPDWQTLARRLFSTLRNRVRQLFAIPNEEGCHFGLLVPLRHGKFEKLSLVAASGDVSPEDALSYATTRWLEIQKGREQGAAGIAFTSGRALRDWRSVLAVPLLAGRNWTPVAAVTLTSNLAQPLWRRFGANEEVFTTE